jgi:spermidine synthase
MLPEDHLWFTEYHAPGGMAQSWLLQAEKIDERRSPYQHIEIYQTESFGKLMAIDGCVMLTTRDNFLYHEMMTHPALFSHADPQQIAIIGGGDCGALLEVLKHASVQQVTQIDIDEQVTRLAEIHFPELTAGNDDPRASLLFDDGLAWIRHAGADSLDVIIIDSTDPVGPAEGLFGPQFIADCYRALKPGGVIVQQSESPLIHQELIKGIRDNMSQAGFGDQRTLGFPQPCYPSGWWSATLGIKGTGSLDKFRYADASNKAFATLYYNADLHRGGLSEPAFLRAAVAC